MSPTHIANRSNRHSLRVVKTVDSEDALNEALENGKFLGVLKLDNPRGYRSRPRVTLVALFSCKILRRILAGFF